MINLVCFIVSIYETMLCDVWMRCKPMCLSSFDFQGWSSAYNFGVWVWAMQNFSKYGICLLLDGSVVGRVPKTWPGFQNLATRLSWRWQLNCLPKCWLILNISCTSHSKAKVMQVSVLFTWTLIYVYFLSIWRQELFYL